MPMRTWNQGSRGALAFPRRLCALLMVATAMLATPARSIGAQANDADSTVVAAQPVNHSVWLRLHVDARGKGRVDNGPLKIPDPLFQRLSRFVSSLEFEPARRGGKPVDGTIGLMFALELHEMVGERLAVWIDRMHIAPLPIRLYNPSFPAEAIRGRRSGRVEGTFVVKSNGRIGRLRTNSSPAEAIVFLGETTRALLNAQYEAPTVDGEPAEIKVAFCYLYHWDPESRYGGPPCTAETHQPVDEGVALTRLSVAFQRQEIP